MLTLIKNSSFVCYGIICLPQRPLAILQLLLASFFGVQKLSKVVLRLRLDQATWNTSHCEIHGYISPSAAILSAFCQVIFSILSPTHTANYTC